MADGRVSTGTPELDRMLHGGLVAHRPYLVVGPSGTGKTTLALQFLCEGARHGEEGLIVTLEEPPNEMRFNHRNLQPDLDRVYVFDAIPDVMRYERTPFKDVAQVRDAVPFSEVPDLIRKTPELTSVEVTLTALEQTLKMQRARHNYSRLVIDSLTALQYFCMKGIDEVQGAQSFLRFLSDLHVTTMLTVESPAEDVESPERMLARGEIRLFRWDLEGRTVRAMGVEKFRGSAHDVRLHPYRIGRHGLDIDLEETVSRDTRQILHSRPPTLDEHVAPIVVTVGAPPGAAPADPVNALLEGLSAEIADLRAARQDLGAIRASLAGARAALVDGEMLPAQAALVEVRALVHQMSLGHWSAHARAAGGAHRSRPPPAPPPDVPTELLPPAQLHRLIEALHGSLGAEAPDLALPSAPPSLEPPAPPPVMELATPPSLVPPPPPPEEVVPTPPALSVPPPGSGRSPPLGLPATTLPPPNVALSEPSPPAREPAPVVMPAPLAPAPDPVPGPVPPSTIRAPEIPAEPPGAPVPAAGGTTPVPTPTPPAPVAPPTPSSGPGPAPASTMAPAEGRSPGTSTRTAPSPVPSPEELSSAMAFGPTFESLTPAPAAEAPTPPRAEPPAPAATALEPPSAPATVGAGAAAPSMLPTAPATVPGTAPTTSGEPAAPKRHRRTAAAGARRRARSPEALASAEAPGALDASAPVGAGVDPAAVTATPVRKRRPRKARTPATIPPTTSPSGTNEPRPAGAAPDPPATRPVEAGEPAPEASSPAPESPGGTA